MVIKKYPEGEINEFDSLDELRAFDPHFIENVDSIFSITSSKCSAAPNQRFTTFIPLNKVLRIYRATLEPMTESTFTAIRESDRTAY
ncbi:MAG: hypothetical protein ACLU0O_09340 [Collinsella sp.]